MTKEALLKFEEQLANHGYKREDDYIYKDGRYHWYKSIRKYITDTDYNPDILIEYSVHDFSMYEHNVEYQYGIEITLYLDEFKDWDYFRPLISTDMPIEKVEEMSISLLEWARQFLNVEK